MFHSYMKASELYSKKLDTVTNHEFSQEKMQQKMVENFVIDDFFELPSEEMKRLVPLENNAIDSNGSSLVTENGYCNSSFSGGNNLLLPHRHFSDSGEVCMPYDDLTQIEWQLNETVNSFSTEELKNFNLITGKLLTPASSSSIKQSTNSNKSSFSVSETSLPPKAARSKRPRINSSNWCTRLFHVSSNDEIDAFRRPAKITSSKRDESASNGVAARKCLHCAAEKTPQWRTGPMGPKTLCNACGVRYKSGRLVPEYRPAASPTFVSTKHSNSHRKVMELRRQREVGKQQEQRHDHFTGQCSVYGMPNGEGDEFLVHHHEENNYRNII